MAFLAGLNSLEKQLVIYGVGGYTVWSFGMSLMPNKHAHAEEAHAAPVAQAAAPAPAAAAAAPAAPAAAAAVAAAPAFSGANDPAVLFALQDIQTRLSVIEKALKA